MNMRFSKKIVLGTLFMALMFAPFASAKRNFINNHSGKFALVSLLLCGGSLLSRPIIDKTIDKLKK